MSGFLGAPSPRWFTIAAHRPFLEDLAAGVWKGLAAAGPVALAEATILIPTRRGARALAEAFLKAAGIAAVLLPQIRVLGDLDEGEPPFEAGDVALDLAPAIPPLRRRFELARLVVENEGLLERRLDAGSALELADALAAFLDGCQIEEVGDPAAVGALVEGELARHWQVSARFLNVALDTWPKRLEKLGLVDAKVREVALLRALADRWRDRPPAGVLIAAGSTGSTPAAAGLLAVVAAAPKGCVVLPGLDKSLAETAWAEVDDAHPQGALKRLLDRSGIARAAVRDWDPAQETEGRGRWRRRVVNEALRPPAATADWLAQIGALRAEAGPGGTDPIAEGLAGLVSLTVAGEEAAAAVIALLLREALETPGKTAALITPDAALARRVSARLTRWNITADSSAGQPLASAPAAVLASLIARAVADPTDPVTLLAIVKHPLTRLGLDEETLGRARRALERHGLRGARPAGWAGLTDRLRSATETADSDERLKARAAAVDEALDLAERLRAALGGAQAPYAEDAAAASAAARGLIASLEALAAGPRGGLGELWAGQGGEAAAAFFAALVDESEGLPPVTRAGFAQLIDGLMADQSVRPGGASHPRLRILGALEGRLVRADRLILAGLEEGLWPRAAPIDPFLSRPMRAKLGLPSPERRIGLSAHDFAQGAAAPEVFLIDAERRGGTPATPSRWLWRLRTLARGAGVALPGRPEVLAWARALDAPLAEPPPALRTASRPRPAPPVAVRPRRMSVTAVERWVRDPYAIYARDILRLRSLEPPDAPVEAMARGSAIHKAFQRFAENHPDVLPDDAEARFATLVIEELEQRGMPAARMARERALAANVAPWVMAFERGRRPGIEQLFVEKRGEHVFEAAGGPFVLTARADRLEARGGRADILDFKTGAAPSAKQVKAGFSPQLTLTAALLARGGFTELGPTAPGELLYVRVSGGRVPGREERRGAPGESAELAEAALEGLRRRIARFDDPATDYPSWAAPQFIGARGGDYDHLARLWEWHVIGEGEAEGGE
ncbi:MAG: double-strand break repair protein AddB [Caulobacteraceae bacterium]